MAQKIRTHSVTLALLSALMVALSLLSGHTSAYAHDAVIKSSPAEGATLSAFPTDVTLTMSANPNPEFNTIAVSNKDTGEILAKGTPTIEGNVLSLDLPDDLSVPAGNYTVGFQITSSDGHATRGAINFTYAPEGAPAAATTPGVSTNQAAQDTADSSSGSTMPWLIIGLVVIVVICALVALVVRRTRHR